MEKDKMETILPSLRPFAKCEPYDQNEPGKASFRWVLKKNEISDICMGLVELQGPIHKTSTAHEEWNQVYLIFSGSGTIHVGRNNYRITEPSAVTIPKGEVHSVELAEGEKLQYIYVNRMQ